MPSYPPGISRLVQNIGILLGSTFFARGLSAVTLIILARALPVENFGQYIAVLALLRITSVAFSLGLDSWMLHICGGAEEIGYLAQIWTISAFIKIVLGIGWLGGIVFLGYLWQHPIFTPTLLLLGGLAIWSEEFASIGWTLSKATLRNHITFFLMSLFQGAVLAGTLLALALGARTSGAFLFARVLAAGSIALFTAWWLAGRIGVQFDISLVWPSARAAIPFGLSMLLALVYGRADLAIVAYWLGSKAAGVYGPAVTLLTTFLLIPASVYGVVLPHLSGVFRDNPHHLKNTVRVSLMWHGLLGLILGVVVFIAARPLAVFFYGATYSSTGDILRIFSPIFFIRSVTLALTAALVAVGMQKQRVLVQLSSALFNVTGNVLLIPIFQLPGVAFMYVASEAILMIGSAGLFWRWQHQALTQVSVDSVPV